MHSLLLVATAFPDICPESAVSVSASNQWDGKESKCSDINKRLAAREEADGEVCVNAKNSLQESFCIDQCLICDKSQEIVINHKRSIPCLPFTIMVRQRFLGVFTKGN
jgi:hypothetical protein